MLHYCHFRGVHNMAKQLQETLAQDLGAGDALQSTWGGVLHSREAQAAHHGVKHWAGKTQPGLLYVACHRQEKPQCHTHVWEGASPAHTLVHKTSEQTQQSVLRSQGGSWRRRGRQGGGIEY